MALQKATTFKSIDLATGYYKITSITSISDYDNEDVKNYNLTLNVSLSKEQGAETLEQKSYTFSGLVESELTYAGVYRRLKAHEEFEEATDV